MPQGRCQGKIPERSDLAAGPTRMTKPSPFHSFKTGPEIIRLAVMFCARCPLPLRTAEEPLH
jgi:hypothetical protein